MLNLIVAFTNSTRGRNHFKNYYARHLRVMNWFKDVVFEATTLMNEMEKGLEKS